MHTLKCFLRNFTNSFKIDAASNLRSAKNNHKKKHEKPPHKITAAHKRALTCPLQ